jgi:hypothetical protein
MGRGGGWSLSRHPYENLAYYAVIFFPLYGRVTKQAHNRIQILYGFHMCREYIYIKDKLFIHVEYFYALRVRDWGEVIGTL